MASQGLTFNVFGHDVSATSTLHKVEGEAGKTSSRIGSGFKKMGGVIGGALAGVGITSFLSGSIDEATEAQKVGAQTAAVLKSTGNAAGVTAGQIGDLATAISNKAGIDDEAIQSGENLLLTFTNVRNEAGKGNDVFNQATQAMTDLSAATGQSMKSSAIQLGKALNDPIKGVTALSRVGVSFTDQQKTQIAAMVDAGNTMGAQKLILGELNKEFAGSAEAQATPAEKAAVAWGNLKEQIGTYLLPVIAALSNFIVQHVIPVLSRFAGWVNDHREGFIKLGKAVAAVAKGVYQKLLVPLFHALVPVVKAIIGWIQKHREGIEQLAKIIATVVVVAVKVLIGIIKTAIEVITAIVKAVIAAGKGIAAAFRTVRDVFKVVWHKGIKPVLQAIATVWVKTWDVVKAIYTKVKDGIRAVRDVVVRIVKAIKDGWHGLGDAFHSVWRNAIKPVWDGLKTTAQFVWNQVLKRIFDAYKTEWRALSTVFKAVWQNGIKPVVTGVADVWKTTWDVVQGIYGKIKDGIRTVRDVIKNVVGIIKQVWHGLGSGLKAVWDNTLGPAIDDIKSAINWLIDKIEWIVSKIAWIGDHMPFGGIGRQVGHGASDVIDQTLHNPFANAQGTGFFSGGATWVGERGPELVTLPRGSQITSHTAAMSQAGDPAPVVVNINLPGGQFFMSKAELGRTVLGAVEAAVQQGARARVLKGLT